MDITNIDSKTLLPVSLLLIEPSFIFFLTLNDVLITGGLLIKMLHKTLSYDLKPTQVINKKPCLQIMKSATCTKTNKVTLPVVFTLTEWKFKCKKLVSRKCYLKLLW